MYIGHTMGRSESRVSLSDSNRSMRLSESFQEILRRTLNGNSKSRPPKIELTGILIPCYQEHAGRVFRFKLGTQTEEYLLSMDSRLSHLAQKAGWDEVTVKGYLNIDDKIIDVEKITLSQSDDPAIAVSTLREPTFEIDTYEKMIERRGKLEPALEYMAS